MLSTLATSLLLLLLTPIVAKNTTTSLFLHGGLFSITGLPFAPLIATEIGSSPTAATYVLNCDSGNISDECGLARLLTLTHGPSTAVWSTDPIDGETVHHSCTLTGSTLGTCTIRQNRGAAFIAKDDGDMTWETANTATTLVLGPTDFQYVPVVVVTADKKGGPGGEGSPPGQSAPGAGGSASPGITPSGSDATVTDTRSFTASFNGTSSTSTSTSGGGATATRPQSLTGSAGGTSTAGGTGTGTSTGGVPRITQKPGLALGGALAAAGLAFGGI